MYDLEVEFLNIAQKYTVYILKEQGTWLYTLHTNIT